MTSSITIVGAPLPTSVAPSPDCCRLSGFFQDHLCRPLKNLPVHIESLDDPIVTGNTAILSERFTLTTDVDGFLQFDAFRGGRIRLVFGGRAEESVILTVPDLASANLFDVAFIYLISAQLVLADTTFAVGASTAGIVTGTLSDGRTLNVTIYSTLESDTPAVATVSVNSVTGVSAGSADISISEIDTEELASSPPADFTDVFANARGDIFLRRPAVVPTLGTPVTVTIT